MAVRAQYPPNAFSADLHTRMQMSNAQDELCLIQGANPFVFVNNDTVFSSPQSELTCNASGSRKRNREEYSSSPAAMAHQQQQYQFQAPIGVSYPNLMMKPLVDPSISLEQSRLIESASTSTSGRFPCSSPSSAIGQGLVAQLYQQSVEIDALIRFQNESLRLGLEETRKRHCRSLISALEQQAMKMLKEKDEQLASASLKNAELEERVRQLTAENQIWFNVAKNNEAVVTSLRAGLEQLLLQNTAVNVAVEAKEGYGDSDGEQFPADDAQSCCFAGEEERSNGAVKSAVNANGSSSSEPCRRSCKVCREKDVSVLLLPCRHLCLCKDCESMVDACPVCHVTKNACLQIFMS